MKILVLSEQKELLEKHEDPKVELFIHPELNSIPNDSYTMAFLDQSLVDCRKECRKNLQLLKSQLEVPWGVLDFQRKIKDPMELLHHGWVDYLCGKDLHKRLDHQRLSNSLYFYQKKQPIPDKNSTSLEGSPSGSDWSQVEEGKEYLFTALYAEMLPHKAMEGSLSEREIQRLQTEWQELLDHFFDPWYGYSWIHNGWSSILLFPFNGKEVPALEGFLEFLLNGPVFRLSHGMGEINMKLAGHLAPCVFQKKEQTSHIISETLNDLFHLGLYKAEAGRLYLSEELRGFLPSSLDHLLCQGESYEGRMVYPLKKLH